MIDKEGEADKVEEEPPKEEKEERKAEDEPIIEETPKYPIPTPYLQRLRKLQNDRKSQEVLELFKQVKINLQLLDAIKNVLVYAKYLKDLCTVKRRQSVKKKAYLASQVSAIIERDLPPKYNDPGTPTISCFICEKNITNVLLDLGSSANLFPYSVYQQLGLGEIKPTRMTLQLADRSLKFPRGIVEDVQVKFIHSYFQWTLLSLTWNPLLMRVPRFQSYLVHHSW